MQHAQIQGSDGPPAPSLFQWLFFALLVAFFGTSFLFIKVGVETVPPISLVTMRLGLAAIALTIALYAMGRSLPPLFTGPYFTIGSHWRFFPVLALTGNILPFTLISWGQQSVPSSLAGILMAIMPLSTMGLAAIFVAGEHITIRRIAGFAMGFLGIVILFGAEALGLAVSQPLDAQAVIVLAALFYAAAAILTKKMPRCDPLAAAAAIHICATLMILPFALVFEAPWTLSPSAASLGSVASLALGSSAISTVLLLYLIRDVGPTFTSQLNYLVPVWAVMMGYVFLDETPRWNALGALVLILTGIAVAQSRARRISDPKRSLSGP